MDDAVKTVKWENIALSPDKRRQLPSRRLLSGNRDWSDEQFAFFVKRQATVEQRLKEQGIVLIPCPPDPNRYIKNPDGTYSPVHKTGHKE